MTWSLPRLRRLAAFGIAVLAVLALALGPVEGHGMAAAAAATAGAHAGHGASSAADDCHGAGPTGGGATRSASDEAPPADEAPRPGGMPEACCAGPGCTTPLARPTASPAALPPVGPRVPALPVAAAHLEGRTVQPTAPPPRRRAPTAGA